MFTEIIKIIEGGLQKDVKKVSTYAKLLAEHSEKSGDKKLSDKILRTLKNINANPVYLDQLVSSPVDQETRMNIVDLVWPSDDEIPLIISKQIEDSIENFISMNTHRNILRSAGLEVISSLLLYGPPGCGKTSIAMHISKTLKLPLVIARLDSLVSSLLGSTSKNIRKIFDFASSQPCILFLDEFDAIAKARDDQHELGELKRVINSLLQNIDEFSNNHILIAATNHHELLDKAIWRRFNHIIEVKNPDEKGINSLLNLYFKNHNQDFLQDKKKLNKIINSLENLSPSDIKSVIHTTIAKNIIDKKGKISLEDLLIQIFLFKHHGSYSQEELVGFLKNQGVSQNLIKEKSNISIRKVRNILK